MNAHVIVLGDLIQLRIRSTTAVSRPRRMETKPPTAPRTKAVAIASDIILEGWAGSGKKVGCMRADLRCYVARHQSAADQHVTQTVQSDHAPAMRTVL